MLSQGRVPIEEVESTGDNAFVVWSADENGITEYNPDMFSGGDWVCQHLGCSHENEGGTNCGRCGGIREDGW